MAPTPSIKITKSTGYKAGTRLWSNRYHFNGGTPTDSAHWTTFSDLVVADEADSLLGYVTITGAIGYAAGSDVPVWSKSYSTAGALTLTGSYALTPLETAALVRYSTTARSIKNHPIYLYNYVHAVARSTTGQETLFAQQKTALEEYADDWMAGFSDGVNTYVRAGPNGATATGKIVATYLTHRDFPN